MFQQTSAIIFLNLQIFYQLGFHEVEISFFYILSTNY
jgi:hypothetical protein